MKKMKYTRNVSQKCFDTGNRKNLPVREGVLKERLTDPNNVSHTRSVESITISHKTYNHSNVDSEVMQIANLKGGQPYTIISTGADLEKKIQNLKPISTENVPKQKNDQSQGMPSVNYGSPVSIFNPNNKGYVPALKSGDKTIQENMTLEELISKIDDKRDKIKKSVREELEDYFNANQSTPQFTESTGTQLMHQSINDQINMKSPPVSHRKNIASRGRLLKRIIF